MLISIENEQISLPSANVNESLKSSPMESNPDSLNGLPSVSDLPDSPPLPTIYTDVNVVPEHEKNELQQSISSLEGRVFEPEFQQSKLFVTFNNEGHSYNTNIFLPLIWFCRRNCTVEVKGKVVG